MRETVQKETPYNKRSTTSVKKATQQKENGNGARPNSDDNAACYDTEKQGYTR